jgi:hypothetical protein
MRSALSSYLIGVAQENVQIFAAGWRRGTGIINAVSRTKHLVVRYRRPSIRLGEG